MTNTEPLDLDAIEARATAATPGAWAYDQIPETGECRVIWDGNGAAERDSVYAITSGGSLACNAEFIAHAREDVPALIAEVRRLRIARNEARDEAGAAYAAGFHEGMRGRTQGGNR